METCQARLARCVYILHIAYRKRFHPVYFVNDGTKDERKLLDAFLPSLEL